MLKRLLNVALGEVRLCSSPHCGEEGLWVEWRGRPSARHAKATKSGVVARIWKVYKLDTVGAGGVRRFFERTARRGAVESTAPPVLSQDMLRKVL